MNIRLPIIVTALLAAFGCSKSEKSASDLYSFSDTKQVAVRINIEYKLLTNGGPTVEVGEQQFHLNTFLLIDGVDTQVATARAGESPVMDLPVTLVDTQLEFDAVVAVPVTYQPPESGFTMHFSLRELGGLGLNSVETVKNLDALRGGIHPGSDASANKVSMSLATTLAYQISQESEAEDKLASFNNLVELVVSKLSAVEQSLDNSKKPQLAPFAAAVLAGIKMELANDQTAQAQIMEIISPKPEKFHTVLKSFAETAQSTLGSTSTAEAKTLFKTDAIIPSKVPDPTNYVSVVTKKEENSGSADTTAPVVTIVAPAASAATNASTITVSGSCTVGDLDVQIAGAGVSNPGKAACVAGGNGKGTFTFQAQLTSGDGVKVITATQKDAAGNTGSLSRSITLDTVAPSVSISSPSANATVGASFTLTGSCESGSIVHISGARLAASGTASCVNGSFSYSAASSNTNGAAAVVVTQTDAAGNSSSVTRSLSRTVTVPVVAFTGPAANTIAKNGVTVSGTCTVGSQVQIAGSGVANPGSANCVLDAIAKVGRFSYAVNFSANDGSKEITAKQSGSATATLSVERDQAMPQIEITGPGQDSYSPVTARITLEGVCENGVDVDITGDFVSEPSAGRPNPMTTTCTDGTFSVPNLALSDPNESLRTVTASQTVSGKTASSSRRVFRSFVKLLDKSINVLKDEPDLRFSMSIVAEDPDAWTLSFASGTPLLTKATPNGGTVTIIDPQTNSFKYQAPANFTGADIVTLYGYDEFGRIVSATITFDVDSPISRVKPVMAVRATGCLLCHAKVGSTIVTDFGFGNSWYASGTGYDFAGWDSAHLSGKVVMPAGATQVVNDAKDVYFNFYANNLKGGLSTFGEIYIGAPTATQILEPVGMDISSDNLKYIKTSKSSESLAGIVWVDGNNGGGYYKNSGQVTCEGDVVIRGTLVLDNLSLATDNTGCRIYTTGSVFIQGPISYPDPTPSAPTRNLQIASAKLIGLGIGHLDCNNYFGTFHDRMHHHNVDLRGFPDYGAYRSSIEAELDVIGSGVLVDGACNNAREISHDRLMLVAPIIHNRYNGNFNGVAIAEYSQMSLDMVNPLNFDFDPAFDGNNTILPLLPSSSMLKITGTETIVVQPQP